MSFATFTNPYRSPTDVPEAYRKHPAIDRRFRPDGTYLNTLEDPVTRRAIDILHREYGVPLDAIEVEAVATPDRTDKTSRQAFARADLIIYDDRYIGAGSGLDVAFIMLEAMEPGKTFEGDEDLGWNYHYKQLNIYMAASPSARLGTLIEQIANGATPKGTNYLNEGIPFFRIQNIVPDGLDLSDIVYISKQTPNEMKRSQTRLGDLLMTITGRVGTAAVISDSIEEGNINQHISINSSSYHQDAGANSK